MNEGFQIFCIVFTSLSILHIIFNFYEYVLLKIYSLSNPFEFDDCDDAFTTAFNERFQHITKQQADGEQDESKNFELNHNPFDGTINSEQMKDEDLAKLIQNGFATNHNVANRSKSVVNQDKNARDEHNVNQSVGENNSRRKTAALPLKHKNTHIEGYETDSGSDSAAFPVETESDADDEKHDSRTDNSKHSGPRQRRNTEWNRLQESNHKKGKRRSIKHANNAVRRLSYQLPTEVKDADELDTDAKAVESRFETLSKSFDIYSSLHKDPINLYEIGHILSTFKENKENTEVLQKYLFYYRSDVLTTPVFEIYHPEKGTHLVFGTYPRINDVSEYLKYHPILSILNDYNITKLYTAVKYSKKNKSFNYQIQSLIKARVNESTNEPVTVENLNLMDEEYSIVNKEFQRQCDKLFDKIFSGKGNLKKVPFVDGIFITHWNTFMTKYRRAIEEAFIVGDLKAYLLLIAMFWAVVLQFKPNNRCKDLSKVLSMKMSRKIAEKLTCTLTTDEKTGASSITMVSFNLLFRSGGLFENLEKLGWTINTLDERKIESYRQKSGAANRNFGKEVDTKENAESAMYP